MGATAVKIEAKGELLSKTAIAKRCSLHVQTVSSRLEDLGYEADETSTAKNQLYWFDETVEFAVKSAKDSMAAAKIRDLRATYELKELKLAEARGELVPMADAIELVQKIVGAVYQEFTIRQGKRIDPKLAKATNVIAVRKIRKADADRIMKSLRTNFERFIG